MKLLRILLGTFLFLGLSAYAEAQTGNCGGMTTPSGICVPAGTVAARPSSYNITGALYYVTDGASISDCTAGAGSTKVLCQYDGASWLNIVSNGTGITGTLTSTRIPYASGAYTLADSANLSWTNASSILNLTGMLDIQTATAGTVRMLNLRVPNTVGNNAEIGFQVVAPVDVAKISSIYRSGGEIDLAFSAFHSNSLSEVLRIRDARVGIGTSAPRALLDISTGFLVGTGLQLPHVVNKAASANIRNSHDAVATSTSATYVKAKTITLTNGLVGQQRFLFDLQTSNVLNTAFGQIYRNGVALGTAQSCDAACAAYITESEDITQTWNPGDTVELWIHEDGSNTVSVRNFRIAYDDAPQVTVASANTTP